MALVEHQQHALSSVAALAPLRLDGVVEAQHRRRGAGLEHVPARLDAVGEAPERVGGPPLVRRHRVGSQPHPGDHRERAFRSDQQLGEVGSGRSGGGPARSDHGAVGEDRLEADDHVLDLSVARRVLAGAPGRDPAADRCEVEALREVSDRHPVDLAELVFEVRAERAGEHLDDAGHHVDVDDAAQRRRVEDDPTEHGRCRSAHAAAAAGDGERQPGVVADLDDASDLVGRRRAHDHLGELRDLAGQCPVQCQRPPVAARLGDGVRVVAGSVELDRLADRRECGDRFLRDLDGRTGEPAAVAEQLNRRRW